MNNPLDSKLSQNLGLLLARLPLGAYLLLDGYQKVQHGVSAFAQSNQAAAEHFMPPAAANVFLHAFPFMEVAAGAFLVLGLFSRVGGFLASIILITVMAAFTGFAGSNGVPFNPSLILFGLAMFLCCAGSGGISLDRLVWGRRKSA